MPNDQEFQTQVEIWEQAGKRARNERHVPAITLSDIKAIVDETVTAKLAEDAEKRLVCNDIIEKWRTRLQANQHTHTKDYLYRDTLGTLFDLGMEMFKLIEDPNSCR